MINLFNAIFGILMFSEVVLVMLLLKPIKDVGFIRDCWYKFKQNKSVPPNIFLNLSLCLLLTLFFEILWESKANAALMQQVNEKELIRRFYLSEFAIGITCFFISLSLLIVLEKIIYFNIKMAELLDFELMCRHAIVTKKETKHISNASIILPTLLKNHILREKCK